MLNFFARFSNTSQRPPVIVRAPTDVISGPVHKRRFFVHVIKRRLGLLLDGGGSSVVNMVSP